MEFTETRLKGSYLVRQKRIADNRGFFARGFCRDEFLAHGLNGGMLQLNVGFSHARGTLRGLHYQDAPHQEAKFVRCTRGAVYDVLIDLRPDSPTRGQWIGAELTADNGHMLYAPEGFAHGYQTLTDDAEIYYMTSAPYAAASARGVRFDDPVFGIEWPLAVSVMSDQDRNWPDYAALRMSMKRVLLTGASGFIGQHCIEPLLARGYEIHAVSSRPARAQDNRATWHRVDLLDAGNAVRLIHDVAPTHVLHLAWYVKPGKLITSPENFAWTTTSLDLVRAFAAQGGQRFVGCGSAYEYDWNYGYCSERLTPAVPNTVYGACKLALYLMMQAAAEQARLSTAWGRAFFLYGPQELPDRLAASVIRSVLRGEPAQCSHGRQIRDYMHVQDVANGMVALLDSDVRGAVNISSGQATTLREIVLGIGRLLDRPDLIKLGAIPARANDAPLVVGDNARLLHEVGWTQQFELEAGLRHTIDWWKAQEAMGTV